MEEERINVIQVEEEQDQFSENNANNDKSSKNEEMNKKHSQNSKKEEKNTKVKKTRTKKTPEEKDEILDPQIEKLEIKLFQLKAQKLKNHLSKDELQTIENNCKFYIGAAVVELLKGSSKDCTLLNIKKKAYAYIKEEFEDKNLYPVYLATMNDIFKEIQ